MELGKFPHRVSQLIHRSSGELPLHSQLYSISKRTWWKSTRSSFECVIDFSMATFGPHLDRDAVEITSRIDLSEGAREKFKCCQC